MESAGWKIVFTFAMWKQVIGGESQILRPDLRQAMWGFVFGEFLFSHLKR